MDNNFTQSGEQFFDRRKLNIFKKWWIDIDQVNFLLVIAVILFGLMMAAVSSPYVAKKISVDKLFFLKKQLVFSIIAILTLTAISFLNRQQIKVISIFGTFLFIGFLFLVLIFGSEAKGAKRWITIFGFNLQPSEFSKTFFLVFNAFLLQKLDSEKWYIKYGASAFFYLVIASLIIMQPDFGMTLTLTALWLAQLFIFGLSMRLVVLICGFAMVGAFCAYFALPHVKDRINRFFGDDQKNYQVERSLDAYVNGGFLGTGPGNGLVKKYIPDAHTDFIFAVVGEEFGIVSCLGVIFVFFVIVTRVIKRLLKEEDLFTYLAVSGLIMQFSLQAIVNIGVSLGLMPTKGMTLPFISYGGSSIIAMSFCFGMILSLTKKKYNNAIDYQNVAMF